MQRLCFTYLNSCPAVKGDSKLTCLKKKKSYSIPFALPLAPEVLPLPSYGFFQKRVCFSHVRQQRMFCAATEVCVCDLLQNSFQKVLLLFAQSQQNFILSESLRWLFLFLYVDLPLFHFKGIFPVYFKMIVKGTIKIPSEVPHKFLSLKKKF